MWWPAWARRKLFAVKAHGRARFYMEAAAWEPGRFGKDDVCFKGLKEVSGLAICHRQS